MAMWYSLMLHSTHDFNRGLRYAWCMLIWEICGYTGVATHPKIWVEFWHVLFGSGQFRVENWKFWGESGKFWGGSIQIWVESSIFKLILFNYGIYSLKK